MKRLHVLRGMGLMVALVLLASGGGVELAQSPTPLPTPTPTVLDTPSGVIVVYPAVTQGEAAIVVALVLVACLLFLVMAFEVVSWQK